MAQSSARRVWQSRFASRHTSSILSAGPIDPESHNQSATSHHDLGASDPRANAGTEAKNFGRADLLVCPLRFDSQGSTLIKNCIASSASGLSAPESRQP